jgi:S-adenosylmethionine synthetase
MYFSVHLLDKIYDQISDAVLDVHLTQDPNAKVASSMIIVCRIISKLAVSLTFGFSRVGYYVDQYLVKLKLRIRAGSTEQMWK